jgi:hypothetical protein
MEGVRRSTVASAALEARELLGGLRQFSAQFTGTRLARGRFQNTRNHSLEIVRLEIDPHLGQACPITGVVSMGRRNTQLEPALY